MKLYEAIPANFVPSAAAEESVFKKPKDVDDSDSDDSDSSSDEEETG